MANRTPLTLWRQHATPSPTEVEYYETGGLRIERESEREELVRLANETPRLPEGPQPA